MNKIKLTDILEAFAWIHFDDPTHTYTDTRTGKRLAGCTTTIGKYEGEFDEAYWAPIKAKENGISVEEQLDRWHAKRDLACERGNAYHDPLEVLDEENIPLVAKRYLEECTDEIIGSEIRIGNDVLCGTFDNLSFRPQVGNILKDWKTNLNFTTTSEYRLKGLLSHIPKSHLGKYSLQLSIYRFILDEAGFPVQAQEVVHFSPTGYTVYPVPYREWEARYIIGELRRDYDRGAPHRGYPWAYK